MLFKRYPFILLIFAAMLVSLSLPLNLSAQVVETGSLLEFFAGTEQGCSYDNWISHTSEYDYFGSGDGSFTPAVLDRETNGFGSYQVVDDMNNPDLVLSEWAQIFDAFIQGDVSTTETRLSQSSFADFYELVRLTDAGNVYLILREVLNNNYVDDNGTPGDASDDVTGSFDYGWGLYVNKISPAPANPEVIINLVHPNADYISAYVGIDAYLTIDAGLFIVNGASRNIAWSGDLYATSNSLSDPSRNARTPFHECYKKFVDLIGDEWAIQVHSYNAYPAHDGVPSVQISAERENYTAHPNAPYMSWDHTDIISLTPDPVVTTNGSWSYPEVRIEDYYTASYPGGYRYNGYIPINNNVDLPGTSDNNQMVYVHASHDFVNDRENWLHIEFDEYPDVVRLDGVSVEAFYGYTGPGSGVPTYANYAEMVHYYRPVFQAVTDYMNFTPVQAGNISETASIQEFYHGNEGNCSYDNWVSHISEGVGDAGYNDEGPVELDVQTEGFGNFQIIPDDVDGDNLLIAFYDVFTELFQGNLGVAQNLLTDARLGGKYEIATINDGGDDYYVLREVLNNYYFDDNATPGDGSDDVTGSFDYGWGLYVVNPNAVNPEIIIEVPHPCDDYTTPAIGFDAFVTTGAGLLFVSGAGREVEWTESLPYYNSKSLSDPTRNARTPFHEAHKAAVDMYGNEFVIQIHSYDTGSHPDSYDSELSTRDDYYPNQPVMDPDTYFDIISLTPEFPITANTIGGANHAARRIDDYYSLYYGGGYSHQDNIAISNYVEQPGYSANPQMLYTQANHDQQNDTEPWFHVEHDEFPNVITESVQDFYNTGSGVPTYANYANVVDYFRPMYTAIADFYNGPNQAPVLTAIGNKVVDENSPIAFTLTATDPDGDGMTFSASNMPAGATLTGAEFDWTPDFDQAGTYNVTFEVSDGSATDSEGVTITVNNINRAPVLTAIGDKTGDENSPVAFTISATDPDGDGLTYSSPDLPAGAILVGADFSWTPDFIQAGAHSVTFEVSDGFLMDSEAITITVNDVNRAPVLSVIGDQTGDENSPITFTISATDPDGDVVTYSATNMPVGATLIGADFSWTPGYDQAGGHNVTFEASDGVLTDNELVTITVNNTNRAPVLAAIGDKAGSENSPITFSLSATDPDGDGLTYSGLSLPVGASLAGTDFSWTPDFDQEGAHVMTFEVSDASLSDNEAITINVTDVNRSPQWTSIPATVNDMEGSLVQFAITGSDGDGDGLTIAFNPETLPVDAGFVDNGDGTGNFTWQTTFEDAGTYTPTFTLSDGAIAVPSSVTITIDAFNRAPVWTSIPDNVTNDEIALIEFMVTGSDPDGDGVTIAYDPDALPVEASFTDNGNGTGNFSWQTNYADAGTYSPTFTISDGSLNAPHVVSITVNNINRAPVLTAIGNQSVDENANLAFTLSATDPDGDGMTYSALNLPAGATLTGADFSWTPDYLQAGTYDVTFEVTDGSLTDNEMITITVNEVNQAPVLTAVGDQVVDENVNLAFTISATDPDGDGTTYSALNLPAGATLTVADFSWTPTFDQSGSYDVTFQVSDGVLSDEEVITITVNDINRDPVLAAIGDQVVDEGANLAFTLSATDPDADPLTYSGTDLPMGATLNGADFSWTPDYDQSGAYVVTFEVTDGGLIDSETITITVNDVNRTPVWTYIPDIYNEDEAVLITFTVTGSDPDGDGMEISMAPDGLPIEAQFTDNLDGTGDFTWQTTYDDAGIYIPIFTLTDGVLTVDHTVTITVNNLNRQPTWTTVPGAVAGDEQDLIVFSVIGSDPDGDNLTITMDPDVLPQEATFTDNGGGTGDFSWQTVEGDAGEFIPTFTISDGNLTDVTAITITITGPVQQQTAVATGETAVSGTIQNDYNATNATDDSYQILSEIESGGKPSNRHTYLEHIWSFDITGNTLELHAEAFHSANGEGDDFILSGSFDGQNYTDLITVTKTADDNNIQSAGIDGEATGTYFVKVVDADQSRGNRNIDTFSMDYLAISYFQGDAPNQAPTWTNVPGNQSVNEEVEVSFGVTGTDPEGDNLTITFDQEAIPDGFTFTDNGDGTADFAWTPAQGDEGDYTATFTLSDGELTDVATVPIQVTVPGQDPIMFVDDITLTPAIKRDKTRAIGVVTIFDTDSNPVENALVSITWSGLRSGDDEGVTDNQGQIEFATTDVRRANGYFILTVNDVVLNGWTYDAGQNVETVDSLGVGDYASGDGDLTMIKGESIPEIVMLSPAFPNPFNDHTSVMFGLPEASDVSVNIYDSFGRFVHNLTTGNYSAGYHNITWNARHVPAGVYLIRMQTSEFESIRKVSLIR